MMPRIRGGNECVDAPPSPPCTWGSSFPDPWDTPLLPSGRSASFARLDPETLYREVVEAGHHSFPCSFPFPKMGHDSLRKRTRKGTSSIVRLRVSIQLR